MLGPFLVTPNENSGGPSTLSGRDIYSYLTTNSVIVQYSMAFNRWRAMEDENTFENRTDHIELFYNTNSTLTFDYDKEYTQKDVKFRHEKLVAFRKHIMKILSFGWDDRRNLSPDQREKAKDVLKVIDRAIQAIGNVADAFSENQDQDLEESNSRKRGDRDMEEEEEDRKQTKPWSGPGRGRGRGLEITEGNFSVCCAHCGRRDT